MAHARKDTYVRSPEWWKHLRPFLKRKQNKRERLASQRRISKELRDLDK